MIIFPFNYDNELIMTNKNDELLEFSETFDFDEDSMYLDEDQGIEAMMSMIKASNTQMKIAVELTKLVLTHSADKAMTEEQIYAIFNNASKVIAENPALKSMMQQLEMMQS